MYKTHLFCHHQKNDNDFIIMFAKRCIQPAKKGGAKKQANTFSQENVLSQQ